MKVKFHLPGLRYNFPLNMALVSMMKNEPDFFRPGVEIASFFGEFPTSLWNGGRISIADQCDAGFIQNVVKSINAVGIPIRYTYTNPLLDQDDLQDAYCNFCMKVADNGMNEVLVVSPILEEYIRAKYPGFKINSSTCKEIRNVDEVNAELEKDYQLVVLDYNFNNQFDLLQKIEKKDRCEILVNAICIPNCPRRGEHYRHMAEMERTALTNRKLPPDKQVPIEPWQCECLFKNTFYDAMKYPTYVSPDDIWEKYVPMGFVNFKLEGRNTNLFGLIDQYVYYLMKPERRDEGRLYLTLWLEGNKVINVSKPKRGTWP